MSKRSKFVVLGLALFVALGFTWPRITRAGTPWQGLRIRPAVLSGEGDQPDVTLGIWLSGERPEADVEVRREWRIGGGTWEPVEAGGTLMACDGTRPSYYSTSTRTAVDGTVHPDREEGPLVPAYYTVTEHTGPTRLSRMALANEVRTAPGLAVEVDGVHLCDRSIASESGFDLSFFDVLTLTRLERSTATHTSNRVVPWPGGASWTGESPRFRELTRAGTELHATFEVPVRTDAGLAKVEVRFVLLPLEGSLDDEEAYAEFFARG